MKPTIYWYLQIYLRAKLSKDGGSYVAPGPLAAHPVESILNIIPIKGSLYITFVHDHKKSEIIIIFIIDNRDLFVLSLTTVAYILHCDIYILPPSHMVSMHVYIAYSVFTVYFLYFFFLILFCNKFTVISFPTMQKTTNIERHKYL